MNENFNEQKKNRKKNCLLFSLRRAKMVRYHEASFTLYMLIDRNGLDTKSKCGFHRINVDSKAIHRVNSKQLWLMTQHHQNDSADWKCQNIQLSLWHSHSPFCDHTVLCAWISFSLCFYLRLRHLLNIRKFHSKAVN